MKYALLLYLTPEEFAERDDPNSQERFFGAYAAFGQKMNEAGAQAGGFPLTPPESATTLRVRGGSRQVLDGPYADTKEQLAGIVTIEAPDLDAALDWAAKCPAALRGAVEVRPLLNVRTPE